MENFSTQPKTFPSAFIWRRLHSFMGFWLVGFLTIHLFTNSQAGLFLGDDGRGFIHSVNAIQDLPYLPLLEIAVLGIPFLIHLIWGIKYLLQAKFNSFGGDGAVPYLPEYSRNRAYTWQRITSWLLIIGIIAHVVHMRFIEYPLKGNRAGEPAYVVKVSEDDGLYTLSKRLNVTLLSLEKVVDLKKNMVEPSASSSFDPKEKISGTEKRIDALLVEQEQSQERKWIEILEKISLGKGELLAVSNNFGTAELLMLRDAFKSYFIAILYTLLVLATCYHAFNGLWTFLITWGVTLTQRSQRLMLRVCLVLMSGVSLLGLSAIWLIWINLKN